MKLPYIIYSQDDSLPWIVLINGLFSAKEHWLPATQYLSDHFQILSFDGRHQGELAGIKEEVSLNSCVEDLNDLLKSLNIHACFLVGISQGGRVALEMAVKYSSKVKGLIVAGTYHKLDKALKDKLLIWKKANEQGGGAERFKAAGPWIWSKDSLEKNESELNQYKESASSFPIHSAQALIEMALEDYEINISHIDTPTLILTGVEDILTPISHHRSILEKIPKAKLKKIPGAHASLFENPSIFKEEIVPFLRNEI